MFDPPSHIHVRSRAHTRAHTHTHVRVVWSPDYIVARSLCEPLPDLNVRRLITDGVRSGGSGGVVESDGEGMRAFGPTIHNRLHNPCAIHVYLYIVLYKTRGTVYIYVQWL